MRREQLEHAIRTACQITGAREVIVVGSQAILGTYDALYEMETHHVFSISYRGGSEVARFFFS